MSQRKIVSTDRAPAAIGPYSQAVASGGLVFTSGQIALDPDTGEMVGEDAATQAEQCLRNLVAVLEAAGSSPAKALRCTVYLVTMADFAAVNEVYARTFGADSPPARACVAVYELPRDALVEIDCVAEI